MMSAFDLASHFILSEPKFTPPSDARLDATEADDDDVAASLPSGNIRSLVFICAQCIDCGWKISFENVIYTPSKAGTTRFVYSVNNRQSNIVYTHSKSGLTRLVYSANDRQSAVLRAKCLMPYGVTIIFIIFIFIIFAVSHRCRTRHRRLMSTGNFNVLNYAPGKRYRIIRAHESCKSIGDDEQSIRWTNNRRAFKSLCRSNIVVE